MGFHILLFGLLIWSSGHPFYSSGQNLQCTTTWIRFNDSNFRNAYKVTQQPHEQGCIDECQGIPGCVAVDVDKRNFSTRFYVECWYHGNEDDLEVKYNFIGCDTYVKNVTCPVGVVPGMPGAEVLWKRFGPTGPTGQKGLAGESGRTGVGGAPGSTGSTGYTGNTGPPGLPGYTGFTGLPGQSGLPGVMGFTGSSGLTGDTGQTGSTGSIGFPGLGFYAKSQNCTPSYVTIPNVQSPGSLNNPIGSLNQCLQSCFAAPDCYAVEFTASSGVCSVHKVINNLDQKISAPGVNQLVITTRCTTAGQTDFTGYFEVGGTIDKNGFTGTTGQRGATGATGGTGPSGISGSYGTTGMTGATGATGSMGAQGFQGATGMIGVPGRSGLTGLKGSTGDSGLPGKVEYINNQCDPTWVIIDDVTSPGSIPYPGALTVNACMDVCLATPTCVGVNYVVVATPSCGLIKKWGYLKDKIDSLGAVQLILVARCSLDPDDFSKSGGGGNYAPLRKKENQKSSGTDEDDEYSNPNNDLWPSTFWLTFLSILATDALCCLAVAVRRCSRRSR